MPVNGALFGAYAGVGPDRGLSRWTATISFEQLIGRGLTLDREYFSWDEPFPTANEYLSRDMGRTLILSWGAGTKDGNVAWADIAAGDYDSLIDRRASDLKAFGAPLFFVFHHEPNGQHKAGSPQDFIHAYRHIHDRFVADGVTNVSYTMVMFDTAFETGTVDEYWPGDDVVDVVGVDAYNWYGCPGRDDPWQSFAQIVSPFHDFIVEHHKPGIVAELGTNEDPLIPGRKALWFTQATATIKSWPEIKGISYFDTGPPADTCNWWVDSSTTSLAAFTAMGANTYLNPAVDPPDPTTNTGYVDVTDRGFGPENGFPTIGKSIQWLFQGPAKHTVTDDSGLDYFDSGTKSAGTSWAFTFDSAGDYDYTCTIHPYMSGTIEVPVQVDPPSGTTRTTFTVTWADSRPPSGDVYDVQIQRPGSTRWLDWFDGTTKAVSSFVPDSGSGTYSFRARLRDASSGAASGWSSATDITVR